MGMRLSLIMIYVDNQDELVNCTHGSSVARHLPIENELAQGARSFTSQLWIMIGEKLFARKTFPGDFVKDMRTVSRGMRHKNCNTLFGQLVYNVSFLAD